MFCIFDYYYYYYFYKTSSDKRTSHIILYEYMNCSRHNNIYDEPYIIMMLNETEENGYWRMDMQTDSDAVNIIDAIN